MSETTSDLERSLWDLVEANRALFPANPGGMHTPDVVTVSLTQRVIATAREAGAVVDDELVTKVFGQVSQEVVDAYSQGYCDAP